MTSKIRHYISQSLLRAIYYSLIYPYIQYGSIVWANNYHSKLQNIFILQNKIVRIITFSPYSASSLPLFGKLNFLNIYQINDLATLTFDIMNNQLPSNFCNFYTVNALLHDPIIQGNRKIYTKVTLEQIMKFF